MKYWVFLLHVGVNQRILRHPPWQPKVGDLRRLLHPGMDSSKLTIFFWFWARTRVIESSHVTSYCTVFNQFIKVLSHPTKNEIGPIGKLQSLQMLFGFWFPSWWWAMYIYIFIYFYLYIYIYIKQVVCHLFFPRGRFHVPSLSPEFVCFLVEEIPVKLPLPYVEIRQPR